jgi:Heparinase II/III-like protein
MTLTNRLRQLRSKIVTAKRLGYVNVLRVVSYRTRLRLGIHPAQRISGTNPPGPFFPPVPTASQPASPGFDWAGRVKLFGDIIVPVRHDPPDFLADPVIGGQPFSGDLNWWKVGDPDGPGFADELGDIKRVWELSRFSWVPNLAQRARSGDIKAGGQLNAWLNAWCRQNPPYFGPNWVCGQEASIRVLNLAVGATICDSIPTALPSLRSLLGLHLARIRPTLGYAIAQDNNHGTSEAAALFVGGAWLSALGDETGQQFEALGRKWLEERIARLVTGDGGFSMYSVNYHRVFLDTMSIVEVLRRKLDKPPFSIETIHRIGLACEWLRHMVDPTTGDAPNTGTNDGTRLLGLADTEYRDYRPSVQLACALFLGKRAYGADGPWNAALAWFDVALPEMRLEPPRSRQFDDSGFAVLNTGTARLVMRYPQFRFRPAQADALHVDLLVGRVGLLRDDGTFSYTAGQEDIGYFGSVEAHNCIAFDDRAQMPKLGRFLHTDWLASERVEQLRIEGEEQCFGAGYRNGCGHAHHRTVRLASSALIVIDTVSGFSKKAVLRWRLAPDSWQASPNGVTNGKCSVRIESSAPIKRLELVSGWESRHYLKKTALPVIEIEVDQTAVITTRFEWVE